MKDKVPDGKPPAEAILEKLFRGVMAERQQRSDASAGLLPKATPEACSAFDASMAAAAGKGLIEEIIAHRKANQQLSAAASGRARRAGMTKARKNRWQPDVAREQERANVLHLRRKHKKLSERQIAKKVFGSETRKSNVHRILGAGGPIRSELVNCPMCKNAAQSERPK
jgi:hypothetical protein